jgi:hypothetical protein
MAVEHQAMLRRPRERKKPLSPTLCVSAVIASANANRIRRAAAIVLTSCFTVIASASGCGSSHTGDTSVCNELPDASLCPAGSHPLMSVVGGSACDDQVNDSNCGDVAQALWQCGLDNPTCVSSNGTAMGDIQSCDTEQTAWDECIQPH